MSVYDVARKEGKSHSATRYWYTKYNLVSKPHFFTKHRPDYSTKLCAMCHTSPLHRNSKSFCSLACSNLYEAQQNILALGDGSSLNDQQARRKGKKWLIATRGHRCEICGTEEWMGSPVPLVLDHIDGRHDNNVFTNLRLVCANCDAQLPTYKSRNKGNGRDYRRKQ